MHEKGFKTFLSLFWPRGITRTYNTKALIVVWFGAKIYNKHFRFWNVLSMKCPIYKMSYLWNVLFYEMSWKCIVFLWYLLSMKCPEYQISMKCPILWNVLSMKFPIDEMSWKGIVFPWYVLSNEMSCLWNVFKWNVPTPYIFHPFFIIVTFNQYHYFVRINILKNIHI